MGYFIMQSPYNHSLRSNHEDYKSCQLTLTCLPNFFAVL
jgi:hypothetical protein